MKTIYRLSSLLLLPIVVACPEAPQCESVFDCPVGESCLADGTCGVAERGPEPEPGPIDAGPLDAGALDAGPLDAGPLDAGPLDFDAGRLDAGWLDAGSLDAGIDGGPLDSGFDTGALDAGLDAGVTPVLRGIAAGAEHTCVILDEGGVKCWGANALGQLGLGNTSVQGDNENTFSFALLDASRSAIAIAAGYGHTCVIFDNGVVTCWGGNFSGQLGIGDTDNRGDNEADFPAVNLGPGRTAVALAAGLGHTCAILDDGGVKCWGENSDGQLGLGDTNNRGDNETSFPTVNLGAGRTAVSIAAGSSHTCVVLDNGGVKCWGNNSFGQLGLGDVVARGDDETEFLLVSLGVTVTATTIAAGKTHTCVVLDDGGVKCWGNGQGGALGLGDTESRGDDETDFPAVNLGAGRTAVLVAAGGGIFSDGFTCVVLDNASVKCWGENASGQLGLGRAFGRGQVTDFLSVDLGTGRTAVLIAAGDDHACATVDNAEVKCWGANLVGQLGLGDTQNRGDSAGEMGDSLPTVRLE